MVRRFAVSFALLLMAMMLVFSDWASSMETVTIEVVSQPRITPEGKAQADSKAQQPRQVVSISRGLQRRHRGSDGVMKPLLSTIGQSVDVLLPKSE